MPEYFRHRTNPASPYRQLFGPPEVAAEPDFTADPVCPNINGPQTRACGAEGPTLSIRLLASQLGEILELAAIDLRRRSAASVSLGCRPQRPSERIASLIGPPGRQHASA